jgi:septal ring factor EnvC (AmiA/AmiB activator)
MTAGKVSRIAKLEDEIKQRDRRIAELRAEIDELGDLVERMEENVEDANTWRRADGRLVAAASGAPPHSSRAPRRCTWHGSLRARSNPKTGHRATRASAR